MPPGFEVTMVLESATAVVVPADTVAIFETVVELAAPVKVVVVDFEAVVELAALLRVVEVEITFTDWPIVVGVEECVIVVKVEALSGPLEMTTKAVAPPRKISTMINKVKGERGPNLLNYIHRPV